MWEPHKSWRSIDTAPKDAWIELLIPYARDKFSESECTDQGEWDKANQCFRFIGDDGPDDIQPTHWRPIMGSNRAATDTPEGK